MSPSGSSASSRQLPLGLLAVLLRQTRCVAGVGVVARSMLCTSSPSLPIGACARGSDAHANDRAGTHVNATRIELRCVRLRWAARPSRRPVAPTRRNAASIPAWPPGHLPAPQRRTYDSPPHLFVQMYLRSPVKSALLTMASIAARRVAPSRWLPAPLFGQALQTRRSAAGCAARPGRMPVARSEGCWMAAPVGCYLYPNG